MPLDPASGGKGRIHPGAVVVGGEDGGIHVLVPQRLHPLRQRTMAQLWADFDQVANPLTRVELDLATA
jgi:hypothetical protein